MGQRVRYPCWSPMNTACLLAPTVRPEPSPQFALDGPSGGVVSSPRREVLETSSTMLMVGVFSADRTSGFKTQPRYQKAVSLEPRP